MNELRTKIKSGPAPRRRLAVTALLIAAFLACSLVILFRILLVTPLATDFVSRTLSDYTNHTVSVTGLAMAGRTIYITGVSLENPPGFTRRKMISARSIALTPDLTGMLRGKRSLSRLNIDGLIVAVEKNAAGTWNLSSLMQLFAKKKAKPAAEFFIRHLSIQDTALHFDGHTIEKLGLKLQDFSTKGTTKSKLDITGKDAEGNPFQLKAQGQVGTNPALHLTFDAPAVSLVPLRQFLSGTSSLQLENAVAKLHLTADFRNNHLIIRAISAFRQLALSVAGERLPVGGNLNLEASYDVTGDRANLGLSALTINKLATIRASGSMQEVRKEGSFTLQVIPDTIDLATLSSQLPVKSRREISLSGDITSRGFSLKGSRTAGMTAASGNLFIRKITVSRKKKSLLRGGAVDCFLTKSAKGWQVHGKIFSEGRHDPPLIESLTIPFTASFSPRFKPIAADVTALHAVIMGTPVSGSFQYHASAPVPFELTCSAAKVPLTALNRIVDEKAPSIMLSSGKISAAARLSGHSTGTFEGRATLDITSATGTTSTKKISLEKATFRSDLRRSNGIFSAAGSLDASGGNFEGKPFSATAGFSLSGQHLTLRNALFSIGAIRFRSKTVTGKLPKKGPATRADRIPLFASFADTEFQIGDVAVSGISGRFDALYGSLNKKRSLEGTADISIAALTYRNIPLATGTGRITFDGQNAFADIKGESLEGPLTARLTTGLFAKTRETTFSVRLLQQKLERLTGLMPKKAAVSLSAGAVDALLKGSYSQPSGIQGSLAATGHAISLKGAAGKTLASGISAAIDAKIRGQNITLNECTLSHSQGPALRIRGTLERYASAERKGELSFGMPATSINSVFDVFANALPRTLQEAVCEGTCTLEGSVQLNGQSGQASGHIGLESATLEIPSQKITVAGIGGRLPFSLEFPWKGAKVEHNSLSYSRENYAKLLEGLDQSTGSADRVEIGSIRFGALETGPISLFLTASRGVMKISSIKTYLYDGKLLGNGYLIVKGSPEYGANILFHDVSLKQFCDSFPSIKGYITGRVDGIVSLKNSKGGLKELTGYVNLWTRPGKGEKMLVSKDFLQKLAGKKLRGFFFQNDRPYDNGEIGAYLQDNFLTFEKLDISHTNFLGMKDLSVSVVPVQNRISLDHLLASIREAAARGKGGDQGAPPVQTDLKWLE
jgi:hypothetical protein